METGSESNGRQLRVTNILRDRSPKLAGVYQTAIGALRLPADDGCEAARISVVCHCMRELMNGLPAVMADTSIPRPKPSSGSLMSKLPELIANHPDVDLGADQDMIPVPNAVARAIDSLIGAVVKERGRNRSNAAALVTDGNDNKHPAVKQWMEAYEFFLGWTHLDRNHERVEQLPSDEDLVANMKVVEDVIEVRSAAFFENLHALEDLLAEINATLEEDE